MIFLNEGKKKKVALQKTKEMSEPWEGGRVVLGCHP